MSMSHNRPHVQDIRNMKKRGEKLPMLYVSTLDEAAAAGIHMRSIQGRFRSPDMRDGAGDCFYCSASHDIQKTLADNHVAVVGHIGLIPPASPGPAGARSEGPLTRPNASGRTPGRWKRSASSAPSWKSCPTAWRSS